MTLHDSLYYATPEDVKFFEEATRGLPKRLPDEPYHCGPQNVRGFRYGRKMADVTGFEPRILEIGFNLGHSAACWLELGCEVVSFDNRDTEPMRTAAKFLYARHPNSLFPFLLGVNSDERSIRFNKWGGASASGYVFDLAFIDGGHEQEDVAVDINWCRSEHNIQRFLFDDWYPHHGPGVQQAVFDAGLLPIAVIGSMAYCEDVELHGYKKMEEIN